MYPGPGHRGSTLVHGLVARFPDLDPAGGDRRRARAAGARAPPGPGHLGPPGGRPDPRRVRLAGAPAVDRRSNAPTALVRGHPEHPHGVIDAPIGRSRRDPLRMTVAADGRPSRTTPTRAHIQHRRERPSHSVSAVTCDLGPAGPTRSACTRHRSATRWSAIRCTAGRIGDLTSPARSCTPGGCRSSIRGQRRRRLRGRLPRISRRPRIAATSVGGSRATTPTVAPTVASATSFDPTTHTGA